MIPTTKNVFNHEGTTDRLENLLHNYLALRRKKVIDQSIDMVFDLGQELLEIQRNNEIDFLKILVTLNIPVSTARYYINTYKKFGNYQEIARKLGVSKCRILVSLTHFEIKSLIDGDCVCGLTLSYIFLMTATKLKLIFPELIQTRPYFIKANKVKGVQKRLMLFAFFIMFAFSALAGGNK